MPSSKNIELHWKCKELSRAGIKTSKNSDIVNRDRCLDNGIFLLEVWYDRHPEIVIPERIRSIKEFVDQASKSFDLL
ncbi:hypothetical protein RirG_178650 [Rhizophagus irregularis DAOM 197198w]|uniref:Uncharacterized protein n=1 Tax=Rhizophagus irregularis (strain DAOM 197198w) TaxID=1432141 RepID=A0A015M150_RHIIW|nr:hypothetical protein RirG_178650 [Rhizophagus irregularis DAOM 197198w]